MVDGIEGLQSISGEVSTLFLIARPWEKQTYKNVRQSTLSYLSDQLHSSLKYAIQLKLADLR